MAVSATTLLVLSLCLLLACFGIRKQFNREHGLRSQLDAAHEYRSRLRNVLIDLQDAETGQRGFIITGRESYLAPYRRAESQADQDLHQLDTPAELVNRQALTRLTDLGRLKFAELAQTIALRRAGHLGAALAIVQSDRGQRYMNGVREVAASERARIATLMSQWSALADDTARITEESAEAAGLLLVLILGASAGLISHALLRRRQTITSLGLANDKISALLKSFEIAERVSSSGHWSLSSTGDHRWSAGVFRVFGLPVADRPPPVEEVMPYYVAQDRLIVQAQVARALEARIGLSFEAEIATLEGAKQIRVEADYVDDIGGGVLVGVVHDVTAEKLSQSALKQSEHRYRLLAENSTDMMATMSPDSTILFVSPACLRILGYSPNELIGRKTLSVTHPDDVADVLGVFEGLRRAGQTGATCAYRFRGRHKSGAWIWLEGQPRVEFDDAGKPVRYQDVVREIGSRKAAEEALETSRAMALESERRYRLLAENATDMIARYGLGGTLTYISPACLPILGYTVEEMLGRSTLDLIHPDDLTSVRSQFEAHLTSSALVGMQTEYRVIRRDGAVIWIEGRPRLTCDSDGAAVEYHDVMRDITGRKAMEVELREARTAAEAAARSKADFLANMSHELRTPLNSVVGFSGLIANAVELTDETRRKADIVRESSRALMGIVNDILDFSKFEAEGVRLLPEPTDLVALLRSTLDLMQQQADVKGVKLALEADSAVSLVMVDPVRIRQVVFNLVGNAIKFTERGSVLLALTQTPDGAILISVRDTGVGIAADRLEGIFERFAQADASTSRRYGGTGLGLAICSSIVTAMSGHMGVVSVVDRGSTFSFKINPPKLMQRAVVPRLPEKAPSAVAGLRVLLADDNLFNQELFGALMQGRGLTTTFVSNGLEAVEAVKADDYDLVLMDVQMPIMDGIEATRAIRRRGKTRLPIVALTANVVASQIELCLSAGMDDHLAKPYTAEAALAMMARWTTEREPTACPCPVR